MENKVIVNVPMYSITRCPESKELRFHSPAVEMTEDDLNEGNFSKYKDKCKCLLCGKVFNFDGRIATDRRS